MEQTRIRLVPQPMSVAVLEDLESKGIVRRFAPMPEVFRDAPGRNAVATAYASDAQYGPHKLICVSVQTLQVRLSYHPDNEEILIPAQGAVRPAWFVACHLAPDEIRRRDREGTLRADDFTCASLYPAPRGAEMFTVCAGAAHCEVTRSGPEPRGYFYVTESRDLTSDRIDFERTVVEVAE